MHHQIMDRYFFRKIDSLRIIDQAVFINQADISLYELASSTDALDTFFPQRRGWRK